MTTQLLAGHEGDSFEDEAKAIRARQDAHNSKQDADRDRKKGIAPTQPSLDPAQRHSSMGFSGESFASQGGEIKARQSDRNARIDAANDLIKRFGENAPLILQAADYVRSCIKNPDFAAAIREMLIDTDGDGDVLMRESGHLTMGTVLTECSATGKWVLTMTNGVLGWTQAIDVTCGE